MKAALNIKRNLTQLVISETSESLHWPRPIKLHQNEIFFLLQNHEKLPRRVLPFGTRNVLQ